MLQLETEAEQDAFFQDAGLHLRVTDRAEEDGFELAEFVHRGIGQDFAGPEVAFAAEIKGVPIEFEAEFEGCRFGDLERFARDFRTSAVAANNRDVVGFHKSCLPAGQGRDARESARAGNGILRINSVCG